MKTTVKAGIAAAFSLVVSAGTAQIAFAQQPTSTEQQPSTTTQAPQAAPKQPGPGMGGKMMQKGMEHGRMGQGMGMEGKEHGRMGQGTNQAAPDQTTGTSAPTTPPAASK